MKGEDSKEQNSHFAIFYCLRCKNSWSVDTSDLLTYGQENPPNHCPRCGNIGLVENADEWLKQNTSAIRDFCELQDFDMPRRQNSNYKCTRCGYRFTLETESDIIRDIPAPIWCPRCVSSHCSSVQPKRWYEFWK